MTAALPIHFGARQGTAEWWGARGAASSVVNPNSLLREDSLASSAGGSKGTREAKLRSNAVDALGGVQVLHDDHLEASGAALARGDDRPGQEELPDAVPALAVLGVDRLGVAEPVTVPAPESARVVDANSVDAGEGC